MVANIQRYRKAFVCCLFVHVRVFLFVRLNCIVKLKKIGHYNINGYVPRIYVLHATCSRVTVLPYCLVRLPCDCMMAECPVNSHLIIIGCLAPYCIHQRNKIFIHIISFVRSSHMRHPNKA